MQNNTNALPVYLRALETVGSGLRQLGFPLARFSEKSLLRAAKRQTGLTDFGDPDFMDGFRVLLDSLENDAGLHFIGRLTLGRMVINHLSNRLMLVEWRKRHPEVFAQPLRPPIMIMGLPRSGTTFLHRLIALDPANRPIPAWELTHPFPTESADKRRARTIRELGIIKRLAPDLDKKHLLDADEPEECIALLGLTFQSIVFWVFAPVFGYVEWYANQEGHHRAYREYRDMLQILQAATPEKRLTLKAPTHAFSLDAILDLIPDAALVQTHRDPVQVVGSLGSLFASFFRITTRDLDIKKVAHTNLELLGRGMARNANIRRENPGRVLDVAYPDLVADPIGTVKRIYTHYKLPFTPEFATNLQAYIDANPQGKHGKHRYSLTEFGLDETIVRKHFAEYLNASDAYQLPQHTSL